MAGHRLAPHPLPGPHRTFRRRDGGTAAAREPVELGFDPLPIAYRLEAGHSSRIPIVDADADPFAPLPAPSPVLDVLRGRRFPRRSG